MSQSAVKNFARGLRYSIARLRAKLTYKQMTSGTSKNLRFKITTHSKPHVLFITSNGAGMGHITRCMAIATAGRELFNSSFITLSTSASVLGDQGFEYVYFRSAGNTGLPARVWNDNFYHLVSTVLNRNKIDAIVFDGTWIYRGLRDVLKSRIGVDLIWLRRGLWKAGSRAEQIPEMERSCALVLSPWDVGSKYDRGPLMSSSAYESVKGVTFTPTDSLSRIEALNELGLDLRQRYCLIQLGAGNINDISDVQAFVARTVLERSDGTVLPIIAQSPLSVENVSSDSLKTINRYPLSPLLAAFDFVVSAAGYNTVHELLKAQASALLIPNLAASTDDQLARSHGASEFPGILCAENELEIDRAITELLSLSLTNDNPGSRPAERIQLLDVHIDDGSDAAQRVFELVASKIPGEL